MSDLVEFEKWFCGLNADFPMDQLSRLNDRYFYTTTQALYELHVESERLREVITPRVVVQKMADIDFANGDSLYLKFGGDGDNGEYLIELMEAALLEKADE